MSLKDYFLTDSNKSVMRLTFFMTVSTGLAIAMASAAIALIAGLQDKKIDLSAVVTIIGLLIGGGMLGKAGQTFGEALEASKLPPKDDEDKPV